MSEPVVLCYHAVSTSWKTPLTITPRRLEGHLRLLLRLGYRPATFSDALLAPSGERTFVVTFDDAYRSVAALAAPILDELGVPGTLYVPTGWVGQRGGRAGWDEMDQWTMPGHEHELDLMGWNEIGALAEAGWEIGAHTHAHDRLTSLGDGQLDDDLAGSRAAVEQAMGRPCLSIAYPFGDVDERVVAAAARAGFRTGCGLPTLRGDHRPVASTPLNWRRIGVSPTDHLLRFAVKVAVSRRSSTATTPWSPDPVVVQPTAAGHATPRVAVIIPCFNDGVLAQEAVASALSAEPIELVVIDDASTQPETAVALDALRAQGVRVIRHEVNQGLSAARRTGLAATTAPYVFPLDSDDLLVEGALTRLADRLDAAPDAIASWGDIVEFGTRHRRAPMPLALEGFRVIFRNDYPVCSLFRRDALERVGAWQDVGGMVGYEDWNLWMTFAEGWDRGLHAGPGFVAVRRRLHGQRMLGDSVRRHRALYAELKRTHPRLFAEVREHRRATTLRWHKRIAYPLLFGTRPPLGIRSTLWAAAASLRRPPGR